MKKIFKYLSLAVFSGSLLFTSCETTELELLQNPNRLTPDQASVDLFFNSIQLDFAFNTEGLNGLGASLTRIEQFGGRDYLNSLGPGTLNGIWTNFYQGITTDVNAMRPNAIANSQFHTLGMSETLQAYYLVNLVDVIGDIPWSQAANPELFPQPMVDDDATLYEVVFGLLDDAEANLTNPNSASVSNDSFYGGDTDQWIKLINTLRMKMYLQTRLVDASALTSFNAIVAGGNFISSSADDFQFQYGSNIQQPNTRHPDFNSNYTVTGVGPYRANWLMNLMDTTDDPRIRYYFFRQTGCTPGASCNPDGDEENLQCSLQTAPPHYAGFTFCFLENGYWGRDHGDNAGGPPDGFLKTAIGVYPAAGLFDSGIMGDENSFGQVSLEAGGRGAGISPFMLASYVDFMRAEAALVSGDVTGAGDLIEAGLAKSIEKVQSFGSVDPTADSSLFTDTADGAAFIANVRASYNAGSTMDQWNILAEQYFVTLYGSGLDAFNFYRRTGFPNTLQPNLEPVPGNFPKSLFYPLNETSNNTNVIQKANLDVQVFWDNNPAAPGFPASN